jgi:hypothetical protein
MAMDRPGLWNVPVWVRYGATGIPDPRTLSGMSLNPSPSSAGDQYGTGMGLGPSPTGFVGRDLVSHELVQRSGDGPGGLVPR